jgi:ferredoxin/flavodoxin
LEDIVGNGLSKSIAVFYFSGTGNTELVAERFVEEFRRREASAEQSPMERYTLDGEPPNPSRYDLIGLGFTIHAWNAPRIVYEFLELLPPGQNQRVFLFKCPGDLLANGGSTGPLRRKLARKGYQVIHESLLVMPSNLIVAYPASLSKQLYQIACRRVSYYVAELLTGRERSVPDTRLARLLTAFSPLEQWATRLLRLHWQIDQGCTGCGLCARLCPTANISMADGRPHYNWRCLGCLRCLYACPTKAIHLRRGLGWVPLKEGYDLRALLADDSIRDDFVKPEMTGDYRSFLAYASEPMEVQWQQAR